MSPRRFDYMEKQVQAYFKDKLTYEALYLVVMLEPSTHYLSIVLWTDDLADARKKAASVVDDACKTSGWVFMSISSNTPQPANELECLGYAYFGGDGDTYFHWEDDVSGDQDINDHPSEDKL